MAPRKKNAAIKTSGATSSKAAPLPDWVKGNAPKPSAEPATRADGTQQLFPKGVKTPLNMLYERLQKMPGWEKPEVEPRKHKDGYTCVVTLRKENKQERSNPHTVRFEPKEPGARLNCGSSLEAKHWGATYALFRLFNHLSLGKALPAGPREYWQQLEGVKAQAPPGDAWKWAADPFEAMQKRDAEREAREKQREARAKEADDPTQAHKHLPRAWQQALEVKMAPALREQVEATIREHMQAAGDVPAGGDAGAEAFEAQSVDTDALEGELRALGVRTGYIRRIVAWLVDARERYASADAMNALRSAHPLLASILALPNTEAAIEYLVLYTPEQDLPPKLRPTAASESFVTSAATGSDQDALVDRWAAEKLVRQAGFPRECVQRALREVRESGCPPAERTLRVLEGLLKRLSGWDAWGSGEPPAEGGGDDYAMLEACLGSEALRSVAEGNRISEQDYDAYVGRHERDEVYLRIVPRSGAAHGGGPPTVFVTSPTLPAFLRLALTRSAYEAMQSRAELQDALAVGGVLPLVVEELRERMRATLDDPPALDVVMQGLVEGGERRPKTGLTPAGGGGGRGARGSGDAPAARAPRAPRLRRDAEQDAALRAALDAMHADPAYASRIAPVRSALPAHGAREAVLKAIGEHRVTIVAGETGCGKTTQVPQFILDEAIAAGGGSECSIVVTQPRRVSAMGVASRVAQERLEDVDKPGPQALVGYAIRGERRAPRGCRLLFTTTGVLLRRLAGGRDPTLQGVSHVVVDEVHERSVDSDFLLLLLRDVLAANPRLKVVLMSATIDPRAFQAYFGGGTPHLVIPGRTHPVRELYLEEVLAASGYRTGSSRGDERQDAMLDTDALPEDALPTARQLVAAGGRADYGLLAAAVRLGVEHAAACDAKLDRGRRASVLVFCPGVGEIRQAIAAVEAAGLDVTLLPLHANLPPAEQRRVFQPAPRRKVVVATNVAETSITIPDVCVVIDTGRVREAQHDAAAGVTRLVDTWASRAACKQRAGRAGRTMPGECLRLYTRRMEQQLQRAETMPEMQRTPLEGVVLQVKAIAHGHDVRAFLARALDPPSLEALDATHTRLVVAGAVRAAGGYAAPLTPLGEYLAQLPLDVRLGKLLVLGALFGCLEPMLHIAALLASRPLCASGAPGTPRESSPAVQTRSALRVGNSDLLTDARLYAAYLVQRRARLPARELRAWCEAHGVLPTAAQDVDMTRATLLRQLQELALVDEEYVRTWQARGPAWPERAGPHGLDRHADRVNLLRALVVAALWPSVSRVDQPAARYGASVSGAVRKEAHARELHYFDEHHGRVFLHPTSCMFDVTQYKSNYVATFQKSASAAAGKTYLRDVTEAPLYALLLFGGPLYVDHEVRGITVSTGLGAGPDAWVKLRASARIGVLCRQLRQLLDGVLAAGMEEPQALWGEGNQAVREAMGALLNRDGE